MRTFINLNKIICFNLEISIQSSFLVHYSMFVYELNINTLKLTAFDLDSICIIEILPHSFTMYPLMYLSMYIVGIPAKDSSIFQRINFKEFCRSYTL